MPLKAVIDSIDSVDEGQRDFYKEQDGLYVLDVEPATIERDGRQAQFALEDIGGLKSALEKERSAARQLKSTASQFEGLDPQEVRQAMEELETLRNSAGDVTSKAEELAQKKIDQIVSKHKGELEQKEQVAGSYRSQLEQILVDKAAEDAIRKAGGDEKTVQVLMPHVKSQISMREDNGRFLVEVTDKDGNPRVGDSTGSPMTLEQLASEMKSNEVYASVFPGSGKSGGGTPSSRKGGGVPKRRSEMTREQKAAYVNQYGLESFQKLPD